VKIFIEVSDIGFGGGSRFARCLAADLPGDRRRIDRRGREAVGVSFGGSEQDAGGQRRTQKKATQVELSREVGVRDVLRRRFVRVGPRGWLGGSMRGGGSSRLR
jgi:hypothetical protein